MTTETATTLDNLFLGQEVALNKEVSFSQSVGGWYNGRSYPENQIGVVSRIYTGVVHVKFPDGNIASNKTLTFSVSKDDLKLADPNAPRPRQLGEAPEGDYISPDDPRISWLWADAAAFADEKGYCSYYDKIADGLNIPGRERDFKVVRDIGGMEAKFTVKARSRKLAEEAVTAKLKEGATA